MGIQNSHGNSEDAWRLVIDVDLNHAMVYVPEGSSGYEGQEGSTGKIINIASMNAFFGGTTVPAYTAAKGCCNDQNLASDCADHNICCNAIAPGYMDTEMCANMTQERKDRVYKENPCSTLGTAR